jgi:small subunit ribosomal protein S16
MVPKDHPQRVVLKEERIKYWLGVGGKPTDRVARMLAQSGLMEAPAIPEQTKKHLPRAKTIERQQQAEEAAAAKTEAPKDEAPAAAEEEKAAS